MLSHKKITKRLRGLGFQLWPDTTERWYRRSSDELGKQCHKRHGWDRTAMSVTRKSGRFDLLRSTYDYKDTNILRRPVMSETVIARGLTFDEVIKRIEQEFRRLRVRGKLPGRFHMTNKEWKELL